MVPGQWLGNRLELKGVIEQGIISVYHFDFACCCVEHGWIPGVSFVYAVLINLYSHIHLQGRITLIDQQLALLNQVLPILVLYSSDLFDLVLQHILETIQVQLLVLSLPEFVVAVALQAQVGPFLVLHGLIFEHQVLSLELVELVLLKVFKSLVVQLVLIHFKAGDSLRLLGTVSPRVLSLIIHHGL